MSHTLVLATLLLAGLHTDHQTPSSIIAREGPVYLAYAGPYSSSPSSAFGHLFLVFSGGPDVPVPLWDVVTFSVETNDANALRYVVEGITGGFLGQFARLPFHEKSRDYQLLEDRDIWLIELALSQAQLQALEQELAKRSGRWYPYTFFKRNCAFYLQDILARVSDSIPEPDNTVSPAEVFEAVLKSAVAGATFFRPAASTRIMEAARKIDGGVLARLQNERWTRIASDTSWIRSLKARERTFVHEFIAWKILESKEHLSQETLGGAALLRVLAANGRLPTAERGMDARNPGDGISPPDFHGYTRVRLGLKESSIGPARVAMRFRPASHDEFDPWLAHRPINTLEFLTVEVSVPATSLSLQVDEVVLFSQRSLSPSNWLRERRSWMVELLGRRGSLLGDGMFQAEVRAGMGKSWRFGGPTFVHALMTLAVVSRCCRDAALAPGLDAGFTSMPRGNWRYGVRWRREHVLTNWRRHEQRIRFWVRHDLKSGPGIQAMLNAGTEGAQLSLSIDLYN